MRFMGGFLLRACVRARAYVCVCACAFVHLFVSSLSIALLHVFALLLSFPFIDTAAAEARLLAGSALLAAALEETPTPNVATVVAHLASLSALAATIMCAAPSQLCPPAM